MSSDVTDTSIAEEKIAEQIEELAPIPTLGDLSIPVIITDNVRVMIYQYLGT